MNRPRFSVRTVLVITAILAVVVGWLADRERLQVQLRDASMKDLQQRQSIYAMQLRIQQLEANANPAPPPTWRIASPAPMLPPPAR